MPARSPLAGFLALLTLTPSAAGAAPRPAVIDFLVELLPFRQGQSQVVPDPQPIPQAGPDGPRVVLRDLSDPSALEQQLRALVSDGGIPALTVTGGRGFLGSFGLGTEDTLRGDLLVVRGEAEVFGHVAGNVVTLDGDIVVHRGGSVEGNALALGGRVRDLASGVAGESRSYRQAEVAAPSAPAGFLVRVTGVVGVFLTLALIGFGLVTFARPSLEIVSDTVANSLGRAFVVGLLAEILVVPTFGMLVVGLVLTVVGTLLVPFAVAAYVLIVIASLVMGLLAVAHAMGERHARRRMAHGVLISPNSYRYLTVGLGAVSALWVAWLLFGWVPFAGTMVLGATVVATWLLATVGFGASLLSRMGMRSDFAGRIVPPEALTDEYLWATPQFGVPSVERPVGKNLPRQ